MYCNISTKEFLYFIQVAFTIITRSGHNADRVYSILVHTIFVTANFPTAEIILHLASISLRSDWLGDKLSLSVL